ncbi:MAG TPA: Gfo/Idh/MocA family oxidoreductase [Anaerolineales bacterium]|nr:Gfo/Idh/MocA family oxidoreductase [Anaerolineales bacterium]
MRKVRWGVLGAASIALVEVLPAMQKGEYTQVMAIASRSLEKAQEAARQLYIPKAYGSYAELLADPEIEAVYIPLPNHLHVPWSIKTLEAGKHVLCEKPLGMDAGDAQQLLQASRRYPGLKVMEAFMYHHHPQWRLAQQLVKGGEIGELRSIQAFFNYYLADPTNIRNMADIGGGGLLDVGCYAVSLSRLIFESEPVRAFAAMQLDPQFKTDRLTSGILEFGTGIATFTCSTQLSDFQRVNIMGTLGQVELEIPFNPPVDSPSRLLLHNASGTREFELAICDQFTIQGDLFSRAILEDTPVPTPLEDAIANMAVIDALFQSARAGCWMKVG